jgi:hypothetical protein
MGYCFTIAFPRIVRDIITDARVFTPIAEEKANLSSQMITYVI